MKTLLEIAKENGAKEASYVAGFDVKNEKTEIKDSICFDGDDREAKLKATINAYNAQMNEPVACECYYEDETKATLIFEQYKPNKIVVALPVDDSYVQVMTLENGKPITKLFYRQSQTIPPNIAEYIERLEKALDFIANGSHTYYGSIAKEALTSKPKDK